MERVRKGNVKRVAVVGAGVSGLCCARRFTEAHVKDKFQVVVYEQANRIGGIWVYNPKSGPDGDAGLPINSTSMYKSLRTNLPKEIMEFPDFSYGPHLAHQSFISWSEVLKYLEDFTDHFKLRSLINFQQVVISVSRCDDKWKVRVKDLQIDASFEEEFDVVMVCNGHNSVPNLPNFPGAHQFKGSQMHSHDYRVPETFKDKNVLCVGFGPSGVDIAMDIEKVAKSVVLSHHISVAFKHKLGDNIIQKTDVKEILEHSVVFQDDTTLPIDSILYCTGFLFEYPFLSPSCDIIIEESRFVTPLYKQIINIHHGDMAFIGLPYLSFTIPLFDLQVRFYLKYLLNEIVLPSKEEMMNEYEADIRRKLERGLKKKHFHILGEALESYIKDITNCSQGTLTIPKVVMDIYRHSGMERKKFNFKTYRNFVYKIIDEENYEVSQIENSPL